MQAEITKVVDLFRNSPEMDDEEIFRSLLSAGLERRLAARLVEFVPIAYCRVLLEHTGARFSETFKRLGGDHKTSGERLLRSEPAWEASLQFARREMEKGIPLQEKLQVAGRSPEFDAVSSLLNKGSLLEDIAFTTLILQWPEEGPIGAPDGP